MNRSKNSFYSNEAQPLSKSAFDSTFNDRMNARALEPHIFGIPKFRTGQVINMDTEVLERASAVLKKQGS